MLEGLDKIDWSRINHSHGPAIDVPNWIRAIISGDEEIREETWENIWGYLCHQGDVYEASAYTVPFFIELLQYENTPDKIRILDLLQSFARFGATPDAYEGIVFYRLRPHNRIYPDYIPQWQREFEREDWETRLPWIINAHKAASEGIDLYLNLLGKDDKAVKLAVLNLLTCFREQSSRIIPELTKLLIGEPSLRLKTGLLLALGVLADPKPTFLELIEGFLKTDEPEVVKLAASMSLAKLARQETPLMAVDVITNAIKSMVPIWKFFSGIVTYYGTNLLANEWETLRYLGLNWAEVSIPVIIEVFDKVSNHVAEEALTTLLYLSFDEEKPSKNISHQNLTSKQKKVLIAILQNDRIWARNVDHITSNNLIWYGLPTKRDILQEFLS